MLNFTYILQNPVHINASQTEAIAAITKEFPYFQAARVVHLKGLNIASNIPPKKLPTPAKTVYIV